MVTDNNSGYEGAEMDERANSFSIDRCDDVEAAHALSALGRLTFKQSFGHMYKVEDLNMFLRDKHSPENYHSVLSDPAYGVWMAHAENGEPVGFAVAGPCDLPVPDMSDNSGELIRFYVLQEFQGVGLGRGLLDRVLGWLEEEFDHLYLSVYAGNDGAQRLYARYGFEKVCEYSYMVGNQADPEFIMMRVGMSIGAEEK